MARPGLSLVDDIRTSSRQMVRELGFMQGTLAATDYPPSAVHAILEIGAHGQLAAMHLSQTLGLDKSSISRMVRKLIEAGELQETSDGRDGRVKLLALTAQGQRTRESIEAFARRQVDTALQGLQRPQQQAVALATTPGRLQRCRQVLQHQRQGGVLFDTPRLVRHLEHLYEQRAGTPAG